MTNAEKDSRPAQQRSGANTLRIIVNNMNYCRESFNQQFTLEELVTIGRMLLTCGWDILPDAWELRQVQEALQGKPPRWDPESEKPIYDETSKPSIADRHSNLPVWHPVTEAPRNDEPILIKGDSGIRKPHDVFYTSGRYETPENATHRWLTSDRTNVCEFGWIPTHWMYVSDLEKTLNSTPTKNQTFPWHSWTENEMETACQNIGTDITCGRCASEFFTGTHRNEPHDSHCQSTRQFAG